jgi:hypothetical protein
MNQGHKTQLQMYFQHDGVPAPHFNPRVKKCLNEQFPDRWIGCGGPHNWPLRPPDLTPLDFHEKNMTYERKLSRRKEVHYRIFDAARCMNLEFHISVPL